MEIKNYACCLTWLSQRERRMALLTTEDNTPCKKVIVCLIKIQKTERITNENTDDVNAALTMMRDAQTPTNYRQLN